MRKLFTIALLATVALPAAALAQGGGFREGRRDHQQNRVSDDAQTPERAERVERQTAPREARSERAAPVVQAAVQPEAQARAEPNRNWNGGGANWRRDQSASAAPQAVQLVQRNDGNRGQRDWNRDNGNRGQRDWNRDNGNRGQRDWNRGDDNRRDIGRDDRARQQADRNNDARRDWNGNNDGRRDWNRDNGNWNGSRNTRNWDRSWRNNNRYDWQRYRSGNRNAYRLPRYYAPYGWSYGYRRFSIGATLFAGLFEQNYWISDPWEYRLPPAYWPYQWVRYYNDALLVDTRSGYVVDSIPDIFWY